MLTAGASSKFVVGGAPVTLNAGLSISDAVSTSLIGATVGIGAGFLADDALSVGSPQTGVASSYNAATGVLTLSGAATLSGLSEGTRLRHLRLPHRDQSKPHNRVVGQRRSHHVHSCEQQCVGGRKSACADRRRQRRVRGRRADGTLDAGLSDSDGQSTSLIGATVSIGAGFLSRRCAQRRRAPDRRRQQLQRRHGSADAFRRRSLSRLSDGTRTPSPASSTATQSKPHDRVVGQ